MAEESVSEALHFKMTWLILLSLLLPNQKEKKTMRTVGQSRDHYVHLKDPCDYKGKSFYIHLSYCTQETALSKNPFTWA